MTVDSEGHREYVSVFSMTTPLDFSSLPKLGQPFVGCDDDALSTMRSFRRIDDYTWLVEVTYSTKPHA